jgi:hypothetical protein
VEWKVLGLLVLLDLLLVVWVVLVQLQQVALHQFN